MEDGEIGNISAKVSRTMYQFNETKGKDVLDFVRFPNIFDK